MRTGESVRFDYTGDVQEYTLEAGKYVIKCYGARGGGSLGGYGGYASGTLDIDTQTDIYICWRNYKL